MPSTIQGIKTALVAAGLEIYRVQRQEIEIAERIRLHLMDSSVRARLTDSGDGFEVRFTARSQRSDHPGRKTEELFELVRRVVGLDAQARGFQEMAASANDVTDPLDKQKILDVWYEVVYAKPVPTVEALTEEIKWALAIERYVAR